MRHNLTAYRPVLPHVDIEKATSLDEAFQNATLRPLIKLQNDILVDFAKSYFIKYRKKDLLTIDTQHRRELISDSFKKDTRFKNMVQGMIVGLFTLEELTTYFELKSEIDRRISSIVRKRILDQILLELSTNGPS